MIKDKEAPVEYKYYIGTDDGDGNFVLLDTIYTESRKPELNQWYELQTAFDTSFELYYTDNTSALKDGNNLISTGHAKSLIGDEISESDVDKSLLIFVRVISSHRIEYAVANSADNIEEKMIKAIDFE